MSIKLAVPEKTVMHLKPRISVIGVGGGGGNAVNNMIAQNLEGVDFIVANTDAQALAHSSASRKIQLGLETTQGLGAGARPEVGKLAAEEAREEIEKELEGANMVFITAGMGGGTGSGAAPVVAKIAKEKGILTVGVVTKPFQFEGRKRMETAESAVETFTSEVDSIIIIPNQNLFRVADKKTTLADAFVMADNVLYAGVRSITDLMMMPGLINLDFADIKSIMEDKGKAIMGTGEAEGEDRAVKAAEQALSNPLLDDCSMRGAKGVLINITGGSDITLFEIDEAASRIKEEVDEEANIIFGSSYDEALVGKIRVSIVATGIGEKVAVKAKAPKAQDYIAESFTEEKVSAPIAPNVEIDSNLEKFSAHDIDEAAEMEEAIDAAEIVSFEEERIEEDAAETVAAPAAAAPTEVRCFEDFDMIEKSSAMGEMPKASALFKAIINKNEDTSANDANTLNNILASDDNVFAAKTTVRVVEEEPELFPDHNPGIFAPKREEPEQLIVDDEEEHTPTLIERVTGFSIARRNRKKMKENERFQEPVSPSFADNDYEDKMNLDIPSFLRRR
ncbi:MAG: cell division protein FtsZ [Alphaproteobacteria bacterium]|nr:cell division protein FtsZ [Alphaproteobacteria bacterium]